MKRLAAAALIAGGVLFGSVSTAGAVTIDFEGNVFGYADNTGDFFDVDGFRFTQNQIGITATSAQTTQIKSWRSIRQSFLRQIIQA